MAIRQENREVWVAGERITRFRPAMASRHRPIAASCIPDFQFSILYAVTGYDAVVVGGGVIGLTCAHELASRGKFVAVLEKEETYGVHASRRNSGIVHDGFNRKPGTLRAGLCVRGAALLRERLARWNIARIQRGTLVVGDESGVRRLFDWGKQNGVEGLSMVDRDEIRKLEPAVNGERGLFSSTGTVMDAGGYLLALYNECVRNMVQFHFGHRVIAIEKGWTVRTAYRGGPGREYKSECVINSAGTRADEIAARAGVNGYRIEPIRGEYARVDGPSVVSRPVYPVPPEEGLSLGEHLTPWPDGTLLIGPSAVRVADKEDYDRGRASPESLRDEAVELIPALAQARVTLGHAGIRAHSPTNDFIVRQDAPGLVNLVGIESPGLTASIAIAQRVVGFLF